MAIQNPWDPLLACAALAGCVFGPDVDGPAEVTKSIPVPLDADDERPVEVRLAGGHVLVRHGEVPTCRIEALVRAPTLDLAERLAIPVALLPDDDGDDVRTIQIRHPSAGELTSLQVDCYLELPPSVDLRIVSQAARVAIRGYRGKARVETDAGRISARMGGGEVWARTATGPIHLDGEYTLAELRSGSGEVEVVLPPPHLRARVDVDTESGDVTIDVDDTARTEFSGRTRNRLMVASEPSGVWELYDEPVGDRWFQYRGILGDPEAAPATSLTVRTERGRLTIRCLPSEM